MEPINQRVKEVRQALELSQAKFAKALSMSNADWGRIVPAHSG